MEKIQVRPSEGSNKLQYYMMDLQTILLILSCKITFCFDF